MAKFVVFVVVDLF